MKQLFFTAFILFNFLTPFGIAEAQREYQLLAPLPGVGQGNQEEMKTNFSTYLEGAYRLFFGIAGILAVVMIIAGGFQYATSDAIYNKSEGRERVRNAVLGLLLALGTWVILNTIDPDLLNFEIAAERPELSLPPPQQSGPAAPGTSCTSCVSITNTGLPLKAGIGTFLQQDTASKLLQMNSELSAAGINWEITEAFPPAGYSDDDPRGIHSNICHANGSCVDANLRVTPTPTNIIKMYQAARNAGLTPVYEVKTEADKQNLVSQGVPANYISVIPAITAPHFSLYD